VRSTNSGVSAVVDPVGRVIARTSTFREEAVSANVRWMTSSTVYESLGDAPWYVASIAVFGAAFTRRKRAS
jgi:apolipoprotein N-acyltransferase